jgi:hypothetical protein
MAWLVPVLLTGLPDVVGVVVGSLVLTCGLAVLFLSLVRLHRHRRREQRGTDHRPDSGTALTGHAAFGSPPAPLDRGGQHRSTNHPTRNVCGCRVEFATQKAGRVRPDGWTPPGIGTQPGRRSRSSATRRALGSSLTRRLARYARLSRSVPTETEGEPNGRFPLQARAGGRDTRRPADASHGGCRRSAQTTHRRHDPAGSKDASRDRHSNREAPEASRFLPPATKVLRLERERVPVHPSEKRGTVASARRTKEEP